MQFGPEMVLIIVGFGLSVFAIVGAMQDYWIGRHRPTEAPKYPTMPVPESAELHTLIKLQEQKTPEPNARREDAITSFIAALETSQQRR